MPLPPLVMQLQELITQPAEIIVSVQHINNNA